MRTSFGRSVLVVAVLAPATAWAQLQLPDLANATLEELMNIEVTSVSRREQRAEDVAASIYVISRDEIRRSGLTSIAEVLRLVPGVHVARLNSNKWSVSVRGFNTIASGKLLVMVDGRSIYNPAYSSVLWDTEDVLLEDVERIEVIRGPGGAMWGANAVNGVINIITRSSASTQGGMARVSTGTLHSGHAAFRYGGGMGPFSYRAFVQASTHDQSLAIAGGEANDAWQSATGGFRADWAGQHQTVMVLGATTVGEQRPLWLDNRTQPPTLPTGDGTISDTRVSHALVRWTVTAANGSALQVQSYFDENRRDEYVGFYHRHTVDVDTQYTSSLSRRHTVVAGGGYRWLAEAISGRGPYTFALGEVSPDIVNAFAQDSIRTAGGRVEVTVGAKYEHSSFTGGAFQPSAAVMWKPASAHRLWASAARAVHTPSLVDRTVRLELAPVLLPNGLPLVAGLVGNPALKDEVLVNAQTGYRVNVRKRVSLDAVVFRGHYDNIQSQEPPVQPTLTFVNGRPALLALATYENRREAATTGVEMAARAEIARGWDADASVSLFRMTPFANGSQDAHSALVDGDTPARQWRLHSAWSLGPRRLADVRLIRVGALAAARVPAYTRLDARLEWGLTTQLSFTADGQNLLQRSHLETVMFSDSVGSTRIPRSGNLGITWRF
jgi:iron complex outermembrane recepter protein